MNAQKKRFAIAIALTLTIAATLITALPIALGQTAVKITPYRPTSWEGPSPSGVNQEVLIIDVLRPKPPGYNPDPSL